MNILQDVRYAVRTMVQKPGFTFVIILTLALGIGATTAIFSVVNGVILRPLPYPEPERLVQIWYENKPQNIENAFISLPDFKDIQKRSQTLNSIAIWEVVGYNLWGGAEPERLTTGIASHDYFQMVGIKPVLGRLFDAHDEIWGNHRVALISHGLWQRRFSGDPDVVGKAVTIDGFDFTVVGVLGPELSRPVPNTSEKPDLWRAFSFPDENPDRAHRAFYSVARLKPGVTLEQAQDELNRIARNLEQEHPGTNRNWRPRVLPLQSSVMGNVQKAVMLLAGAVAFVLLIACVNVANLLLARAEARDREIAIRSALGAGRRRLIQQLLAESLLLAVLAGSLGLLLAFWATNALVASHSQVIPRLEEIVLDGRVVAFAMGVTLLTVLVFGLVPAWKSSRMAFQAGLRQTGALSPAHGRHRLSLLLVVCEVALALVLLVGAGLLIRTFSTLRNTDAGFSTGNLLTLEMALPWVKYGKDPALTVQLFDELLPRLQALPGVDKVAAVEKLPLKELIEPVDVFVETRPVTAGETPKAYPNTISPDYFSAMGITTLQGRAFTDKDRADTPGVVVVNQTLARRFWPGRNPIGQRLSFEAPGAEGHKWLTVVGLINDVRHVSLDTDPQPEVYKPLAQSYLWTVNLVVKAKSRPDLLASSVRKEIEAVDSDQAIYEVKTMEEVGAESLQVRRFSLFIFSVFAAIALIMAAVGVYGVMAYAVAQRTQEIGLRMALGAQPPQVFKLVVAQGMRYVVAGLILGIALSLALSRLLASLLYGVDSSDPATFGSVVALLALVALLANFLPARRAAKVSPLTAMKSS